MRTFESIGEEAGMKKSTCRERIINAMAPIRVCDLGGWTDTWFSGTGAVCNMAVYPCAVVQICVAPGGTQVRQITINARNYGERYTLSRDPASYDKHPLLEASIDVMEIPNMRFDINLYCAAPAGCSTGTSAAISVALLGALDLLVQGGRTPHEIAALAHRVETEKLHLQCGIQDQLCSAFGGICYIDMFRYPQASVSRIGLPDSVWRELERRLVLVYLGNSHSSSDIHRQVIRRLEQPGADHSVLEKLRRAAHAGKQALIAGDLAALGRVMIVNTEAQGELHPALVSAQAMRVIELARACGAAGWKVNGAGGSGGSLTILCGPDAEKKRSFIAAVRDMQDGFEVIPTYLSRFGLRRWETTD
jgi:D-glycero-alpha-D-manno-heptose-7-phosphate kinase